MKHRGIQALLIALTFSVTFLWVFHENSKRLADEKFKQFMSRDKKAFDAFESDFSVSSTNALDKLAQDARALQKDYPNEANGYELMMMGVEVGAKVDRTKSRDLAQEMIDGTAPEDFKLWVKGFLYRMDSQGKPVPIKFTAEDGRVVDLAQMRGKVVLVDFWSTGCEPCVAELPRVKAAFEKYQQKGFKVVGISCDTDKQRLGRFLKGKGITWPQYFDGQQQERNKFAQRFGIGGIPHMFFVDKKGSLRFDNVRASGDQVNFEKKIEELLAEQ